MNTPITRLRRLLYHYNRQLKDAENYVAYYMARVLTTNYYDERQALVVWTEILEARRARRARLEDFIKGLNHDTSENLVDTR